ncbi:MAG: hypothetical protein OEV58_15910, partial [Gammaproteobacteria bacterium]|nr:hypothetical protein [Gammaproteobacteria bacterium]
MNTTQRWVLVVFSWLMIFTVTTPALAQDSTSRISDLEAKMNAMAAELAMLKEELAATKTAGETADIQSMQADIKAAKQIAVRATQSANEWKDVTSVTHLSGYASADYVSPENGNAAFIAN